MDDLLADFVAESCEMLEALGGEIVAWEADPSDRARLDSIFRFVHTVKGNCGFFDFPRLQALSHAAEDALADVRAGRRTADGRLVNAVLAVIDRIGEMVDAIETGETFPEGGDAPLIAALAPAAEADAVVSYAAPGSGAPSRPLAAQRSIRLPIELLDRVMSGVSDMVLARNDLARRLRESGSEATTVEGSFERLSTLIADVRDAMTRTRMQRIETLFAALPRLVRDLSAELGKQVMIDIHGSDVELDREMIEIIRDPLTHIIRNAIDHGMETPAARLAAGKREIGLLSVSAYQSGNQILIDVIDDGRGIDGARLVEKAVAAGIVDAAEGQRLTPRERFALMFEPGLSTADKVTSISGRGVGMDVVRSNIERIGGAIEIDSTPGRGTTITLRVPLTLTIIPALTVSVNGRRFAIPRSSVDEIVHAGGVGNGSANEIVRLGGAMLARVRDRRLPCLSLTTLLGLPGSDEITGPLIVLRLAGGELFALTVDHMHDHQELVVKPVAPAIMATGLYAGTTLTDEGEPILLLEAAGLARAGGLKLDGQNRNAPLAPAPAASRDADAVKVLLFTAFDGSRRAMRMGLVDRIEEVEPGAGRVSGGEIRVVVGERFLPLAGVGPGDAAEVTRLFRLNDGATEVGYAFREVIDIKALDSELIATGTNDGIEAVTLIDGEPVELVDAFALFARHATAFTPIDATPVCRLPDGDAWMQNFLRPLVEAAGYRVLGDADEGAADVTIATHESPTPASGNGRVIVLRAAPEEPVDQPGSVYRYDRDGLLAALRTVGGSGR